MRRSRPSGWTSISGVVLVAFGIATAAPALATSGYRDAFAARYPSSGTQAKAGCNTCHGGSSGNLNAYGRDLRQSNAGSRDLRLAAIEGVDSDKEGHSNLIEINAGAQPGWCAVAGCDNNGRTPPAALAPLDPSTRTPPIANAGGPYSGTVNVAITFDGSASSDPDGSVVGYQWNFGDGDGAAGAIPVHAYAATGTYTVTLTVTDSDGLTHSAVTTAQVADGSGLQSPVARVGGPYRGTIATPLSFDGSASSDADGTIVSFDWAFGDGTAGSGARPMSVYGSAGVYTVVLTVTDDSGRTGNATTTAEIVPVVVNQAPTANAGGPYPGRRNVPVAFDGRRSSDPDGRVVAYSWDFGDGSQAVWDHPNATHSYASAGNYTVTLRVVDDDDSYSAAATTSVSIRKNDSGGGGRVDAALLLGLLLVGLARRRRALRVRRPSAPCTVEPAHRRCSADAVKHDGHEHDETRDRPQALT
jgi:PKD repeat protein